MQPNHLHHIVKRGIELSNSGFLDRTLTPKEGLQIILDITNQFERCVLSGVPIKKEYALIALSAFACELFMKTIKISPHVLLFGSSGSGKSLLGNLFTQLYNTATLPPDASGIGKFSLSLHQKCIKVDDAEIDFFKNSTNTHLIKTCYHQISSVTEPGSSTPIGSTAFFITTNICNPFEKVDSNKEALIRRFLQISFDKPYHPQISYFNYKNQNDILLLLFKHIANKYPLDYNFDIDAKVEKSDIVKKSLETMLLIVHQFAVSKLDKNFGMEEEPGLQQEGFDDESLVSILDSFESKEKDYQCEISKDNGKIETNNIRKRLPPKLIRENFASKRLKCE